MSKLKWKAINCRQIADLPQYKIFAFAVRNDNFQEPYYTIKYECPAYLDNWERVKFYCELPDLPKLPEFDWEHCMK